MLTAGPGSTTVGFGTLKDEEGGANPMGPYRWDMKTLVGAVTP